MADDLRRRYEGLSPTGKLLIALIGNDAEGVVLEERHVTRIDDVVASGLVAAEPLPGGRARLTLTEDGLAARGLSSE